MNQMTQQEVEYAQAYNNKGEEMYSQLQSILLEWATRETYTNAELKAYKDGLFSWYDYLKSCAFRLENLEKKQQNEESGERE